MIDVTKLNQTYPFIPCSMFSRKQNEAARTESREDIHLNTGLLDNNEILRYQPQRKYSASFL